MKPLISKCLFGFTMAATMVALVAVLVIIGSMPDIDTPRAHLLCLPDSPVSEGGASLTCGETADRLTSYLDSAINYVTTDLQEKEEKKALEEDKKHRISLKSFLKERHLEVKPAARVCGAGKQDVRPYDPLSELVPIREWHIGHRGFLRYGIGYRNGRLVVPVSGIYNIYSFIDMHEATEPNTAAAQSDTPIQQAIFRSNILEEKETELIRNMRPHQLARHRYYNIYNSFLSAAVELRSGDEIYIKVSNISYLANPKLNYFGVHML